MLIHAKGNLLAMAAAGHFDIIVHGCNCHNDMGGGIAAQIAKLYPEALEADTRANKNAYRPIDLLGNFSSTRVGGGLGQHNFVIANAYTQLYGGSGSFSYAALEIVLRKIADRYSNYKARIGIPYIGCGIAGGDQEIIVKMFEEFSKTVAPSGGNVTLVEFG